MNHKKFSAYYNRYDSNGDLKVVSEQAAIRYVKSKQGMIKHKSDMLPETREFYTAALLFDRHDRLIRRVGDLRIDYNCIVSKDFIKYGYGRRL